MALTSSSSRGDLAPCQHPIGETDNGIPRERERKREKERERRIARRCPFWIVSGRKKANELEPGQTNGSF